MKKFRITFICTGNICRSPLAEGIFRQVVTDAGLDSSFLIDSYGTGSWHEGEPAHRLSRKIALQRGISIENHRARAFDESLFPHYDLIIALDSSHLDLLDSMHTGKTPIKLLREFDSENSDGQDVPDPYYGTFKDYEHVYDMIERCTTSLLTYIKTNYSLTP